MRTTETLVINKGLAQVDTTYIGISVDYRYSLPEVIF